MKRGRASRGLLVASLLASLALGVAEATQETVPELLHLELAPDRFVAPPIRVVAEDFELEFLEGAGFVSSAAGRPTALVLTGSGRVRFAPALASERRQLSIFAGSPALSENVECAFLRFNPADLESILFSGTPSQGRGSEKLRRRAEAIFREEIGRSFAVPGSGRDDPPLSAVPPKGDLLVELRSARLGRLAYARVGNDPEDILLFDRGRGRTIASYPSRAHGSAAGLDYGDEQGLPYEALSYGLEIEIDPALHRLSGLARVALRALEPLETVSLRLDRGLTVTEVRGATGPHQFLQRKSADVLLVRILPALAIGRDVELEISYSGWVEPQDLSRPIGRREEPRSSPAPAGAAEGPILLYSNRVYWFPQSPARNHVPVALHVRLPAGLTAIASGIPSAPGGISNGSRDFVFRAEKPIRYVSLAIGRMSPIDLSAATSPVPLRIFATRGAAVRARTLGPRIGDILRFYATLVGEDPYPYLTAAFVETSLPAGHSPAYLCLLGEPPGWRAAGAGDDAAYYAQEPVFALAHEIAHQWWGQTIGWRNYREQWLSEGLAQYFAALYIRKLRGEQIFARVLDWMHHWALDAAGKGPISLGIRVGEIDGCTTCFAASLYDRGALVIRMLRGLLGEERFFSALRLYFERWKFRRAATSDLERVFEEISGRDLSRFFDQWIREDGIPNLEWSAQEIVLDDRPAVRLTVRQIGDVYELPLSIAIDSGESESRTEIVRIWQPEQEFRFPLAGRLGRVRLNADRAAICELRERARPESVAR